MVTLKYRTSYDPRWSRLCAAALPSWAAQSDRAAAPARPHTGRKPVSPDFMICGVPVTTMSRPEPSRMAARKKMRKEARPDLVKMRVRVKIRLR